jgi:hypothetical protein
MITHLFLVQFGPFQHISPVFYRFEVVGTREEVGGTTTGGEREWGSVGDGRVIFFDVAGCDACQEGSIGRMDGIGTSDDASRCWEDDTKGLA